MASMRKGDRVRMGRSSGEVYNVLPAGHPLGSKLSETIVVRVDGLDHSAIYLEKNLTKETTTDEN